MLKPFDGYNLKLRPSISLLYLIMFCSSVTAQSQGINPSEWKFESQRKEITPEWRIDSSVTYEGQPTLAIAGGGREYVNGHWYRISTVKPGEYFQFQSHLSPLTWKN